MKLEKMDITLEELIELLKSREYIYESEMKQIFGEMFQCQIFTGLDDWNDEKQYLFVYVKNGIAQIPIGVRSNAFEEDRYGFGTHRAKMVEVEQAKFLEKTLYEYKKCYENLNLIIEKQKLRGLFR